MIEIKIVFEYSRKPEASANTIFTHRGIRPSVRPELEADSGMSISVARKQIQPDTPAPPNRTAAGSFGALRWWGVVNTTTLDEINLKRKDNQCALS
jgi:hypothetical protein